jgi:tRNA A-37 threonylcarbamoyl transferase component Bud32/sugar lactone lactonase YvrE
VSPERWERVKQIFDEALELDPAGRSGYLAGVCTTDDALRTQVERLLKQYEEAGTSFLRTTSGTAARPAGAEENLVGTTLGGRYRIERELGRGGSGVAYLARDGMLLDRPAVVKVLHERAEQHPVLREQFRQEMEALVRIRHSGVVSLLDVGELPGGRRYLVMEFVEGVMLRSAIRPGGLELERAVRLVAQICAALTAAHEKGIYHRDLKPENIMLIRAGEPDETVKLIDFGIAKVEQSQMGRQTETWTFVGTINYVSPEQLLGKAGAASDLWALGVVAYELVTGERPFAPETPFHLYEMQRSERVVDPARLRPGLPPAMGRAILRALSFHAGDRQNTPAEFAAEFAAGPGGAARLSPRVRGRLRRRRWVVAAAGALVLAGAFTGWRLSQLGAPAAQGRPAEQGMLPATELSISTPLGVAADSRGNVYFSEYANNRVWRVDSAGKADVFAGTGVAGFTGNGGPAAWADIQNPRTLAVDGDRYLYIVETTTDRVRRVELESGVITHVLGTGRPRFNGDGNPGPLTSFSEGLGIAVDTRGDLIFSDTNNHRIRRLTAATGRVTTIAGTGISGNSGDGGPALAARLGRPSGLALTPAGDIYLFETENETIRRIHDGRISTVAGDKSSTAFEGLAHQVRLGASTGIAMDAAGENLYFTEETFDTLRRRELASGRISLVAGTGVQGFSGDGGPTRRAMMANPTGVAVDRAGNIFVAEAASNRIRRITPTGVISTFAGGKVPYSLRQSPLAEPLAALVALPGRGRL